MCVATLWVINCFGIQTAPREEGRKGVKKGMEREMRRNEEKEEERGRKRESGRGKERERDPPNSIGKEINFEWRVQN